jgi:hypothetical protein
LAAFEAITEGEAAKVGHRQGCPFAGRTRKKFVSLVKERDDAELARLIVEAGMIDVVSYAREIEKGEPLQLAA